LKLLFVTPYYAPAWDFGGPVRATESLALSLVKRGHEVHVWTSDALSRSTRLLTMKRDVVQDGVHVRRYATCALRQLAHFNMLVTPGIGVAPELNDFDVIHLHEFRTFQNAWLLPRLAAPGTPYILTPHGSFTRRGRVPFKVVYDAVAGKRLVDGASLLTALTQREFAEMRSLGVSGSRIRLLPNGVGQLTDGVPTMSEARERLGLRKEQWVVLFLGRLHAIKGPDLLLSAFAIVQRTYPDSELLFAGPDEGAARQLRHSAEHLGLARQVHFLGSVNGAEKEAAYAAADVVVLPSRSEGLSLTLLEALLRAKPVVCTDTCAFDPAIASYAEVVHSDSETIANGLLRVFSDPMGAAGRAAAGRTFVQCDYGLDQVAALAEQIYSEASAAR
jgi:glycosyltransferase involved in cell wall biosynthesis